MRHTNIPGVKHMYDEFKEILKQSDRIVFFGGAGVSTESNIPDFRSQSGIYSKKTYPYRAETMISSDFFHEHPEQFYDFYFHETQNIDGLHQMAGSKKVLELHGSIHRNRCQRCHAFYDLDEMLKQRNQIPRCPVCNGIIKPEVVLYGESLDMQVMEEAVSYIAQADVLIVGGTSLVVYPAAGLIRYFRGRKLILINKEETAMDQRADQVIHDAIGKVMKHAVLQ